MVKPAAIQLLRRSAIALSLTLAAAGATAQPGYVNSSEGIVRNGFGGCWHTRFWNRADAVAPCDAVPRALAPAGTAIHAKPKTVAVKPPAAAPRQPAPAPRPAAPTRIALDSELLFAFDSAALRPSGRSKLDEIALELHGASIDSIEAVGYADRIGADSYNQALSKERAQAVAEYLGKLGLDSRHIRTEGRGESASVTGKKCRGLGPENSENRKLVACLQPDRRVEIEVRGKHSRSASREEGAHES